jgi:hypothetical protein
MNIVPTPHNPFELNLDHLTRLSPMERTLRSVRVPAPTSPHLLATTDVSRGQTDVSPIRLRADSSTSAKVHTPQGKPPYQRSLLCRLTCWCLR